MEKSTVRKTLTAAALAVPMLAVSGCTVSFGLGDKGAPDATPPAAAIAATPDDTAATGEDSPTTEAAASSAVEASGGSSELSGAPADFTPTAVDTELGLDESAHLITENYDGNLQYWEATVTGLRPVSVEEATRIAIFDDLGDVEQFVCVEYEVELLGTAEDPATSTAAATATLPFIQGVGTNKMTSNYVMAGIADEVCGIPDSPQLPTNLTGFAEGTGYQGASLAYESTAGGNDPVGARFSYDIDEAAGFDGYVYWS